MRFQYCLAAVLALLPAAVRAEEKPKQIVIVSFDGAHDNRLWLRSRRMADETGARFTYFLSCTFLMSQPQRHAYQAPHQKKGRSNTGFAQTEKDVRERLGHIWRAHLDGHEIGSHACGHFDGAAWTKADWTREFAEFDATLLGAWKANGAAVYEPKAWADFVRNDIKGFRAPYLSSGSDLVPALKAHGFTYDASLVSRGPAAAAEEAGLLRFALPQIAEGPAGKRVIAMDYNLFVRHSLAIDKPSRAAEFSARTLDAFRNAFDAQYSGDRVPLQFGFHFVEMNGGAYWDALETFLRETCSKPDVACVSYAQAIGMGVTKAAANGF